jgi:hypothetical protein
MQPPVTAAMIAAAPPSGKALAPPLLPKAFEHLALAFEPKRRSP